jgi:Phage tail lysozyme
LNKDFDLAEHQVADILGNLGEECNGFTAMQEEKPLVPGSRGGYGWAQWTGSRRVKFEDFCRDQGLGAWSDEANYGFLKLELQTSQFVGSGRAPDLFPSAGALLAVYWHPLFASVCLSRLYVEHNDVSEVGELTLRNHVAL